ncbi:MAG: ATP-binding protein [Caulobacter sp.]|nr:ATP-binding protein [Caulobacter sp.]
MLLRKLGFDEYSAVQDGVAILVGPNGAGKSRALREIALEYGKRREVVVVSNAAHDRFKGMRLANRLSFGRGGDSARSIIKRAMGLALDADDSSLFQARAVLEYCGYDESIGFRFHLNKPNGRGSDYRESIDNVLTFTSDREVRDLDRAMRFLERFDPEETFWTAPGSSGRDLFSRDDLASVLRSESLLRQNGLLRSITVYLRKNYDSIELSHASSGELSLISSLIFMIATVPRNGIVLIDEPENSLHPSWQREYIDKLLVALSYRNATIVVATHSPLIVTGSLAHNGEITSVYRVDGPTFLKLDIHGDPTSTNSIEEVLWKAFEVVTPANHFVSEAIVEAIDLYERRQQSKADVLALVDAMQARSDDVAQTDFFKGVRQLLDRIEARMNRPAPDIDDDA